MGTSMSLLLLPRKMAAAIDSFPFPFAQTRHRISAMQHVLGRDLRG